MRLPRRRILLLLLALTLGAATTLAIAITCGLTLEPPYGHDLGRVAADRAFILDNRPWTITEWRRPGASLPGATGSGPQDHPTTVPTQAATSGSSYDY